MTSLKSILTIRKNRENDEKFVEFGNKIYANCICRQSFLGSFFLQGEGEKNECFPFGKISGKIDR